MKNIYNSITEMVGKTPLLRLNGLMKKYNLKTDILAKCEFYNPLFSIKDRAALYMIEQLEKQGKITPETVFVEATSGNTGIALAAMCSQRGYKLVITMPENMSRERIVLMRHLGAEVILTPREDGMKGALAKADMLREKNPNVIIFDQFSNAANVNAHRFGTSVEILEDTGGDVDVLIAGVGTAGTLTGIVSTLKTSNPDLYAVAVEPKNSSVLNGGKSGIHGIQGIGAGFIPPLYEHSLVDEIFDVSDEQAMKMTEEVAQAEGLPIGISAGAVVYAAVQIARRSEFAGKQIVVILPDAIDRYLSSLK